MAAARRKAKPGPKVYFGEKGWRFIRLWETLFIVIEAEKPLSAPEVNERLARMPELREFVGNLAVTRDDLWTLVRCSLPLMLISENGEEIDLAEYLDGDTPRRGKLKNTRWCLRPGNHIGRIENPRQRRPSSTELTTLSLLRALLRDDVPGDYPVYQQLKALLDGLHLWLAGHIRGADRTKMVRSFLATGKRNVKTLPETKVLAAIAEGLQRKRVVEGDYLTADGREHPVQVLPLAAWFHEGRGQIFGARVPDGSLRVYRLDRLRNARVTDEIRPPKVDDNEVERLLTGRFGGYVAEPQRVKLLADPVVAYLFDEFEFHPSQKIRRRRDGYLTVTLNCAVSYSLEEWVLGFGEHLEVIEPEELRETVAGRLRAALAKYSEE